MKGSQGGGGGKTGQGQFWTFLMQGGADHHSQLEVFYKSSCKWG